MQSQSNNSVSRVLAFHVDDLGLIHITLYDPLNPQGLSLSTKQGVSKQKNRKQKIMTR